LKSDCGSEGRGLASSCARHNMEWKPRGTFSLWFFGKGAGQLIQERKSTGLIIVISVLLAIILSLFLNLSLLYPLGLGMMLSTFLLGLQGLPLQEAVQMMFQGLRGFSGLYLFILLIGANVAMWMASGAVPAMIYFGFSYLDGGHFLFIAFLFTAVISVFMGSAVGTIGTLGLAILGIGQGLNIPPGVILGMLVAGAFVADKVSPLSALVNLKMQVTGVQYRDLIGHMKNTFIPVFLLAILFYLVLGAFFAPVDNGEMIISLQEDLRGSFNLSPLLFVLPILTIVLPLLGINILLTMMTVVGGGALLAIFVQGTPGLQVLNFLINGFAPTTSSPQLNSILLGGGMLGMVEVVFIVGAVIALSSLLEKAGVLQALLQSSIDRIEKRGQLLLRSGLMGSFLTAFDQTVGIVLTAGFYRKKYRELGIPAPVLARTISDSSTVLAPIIPWNVNVVIISALTGISVLDYGPYAFLCYVFPLAIFAIYPVYSRGGQEQGKGRDEALFS